MSTYTTEQAQAAGWVFLPDPNAFIAEKQYSVAGYSASTLKEEAATLPELVSRIERRELQLGGASDGAPLQTVTYPGDVRISDAQHVALQTQNLQPVSGDLLPGVSEVVAAGSIAEGQEVVVDPSEAPQPGPGSSPSSEPTSATPEDPSLEPISTGTGETSNEPVAEGNIEDALPPEPQVPPSEVAPATETPSEGLSEPNEASAIPEVTGDPVPDPAVPVDSTPAE